MLQYYEPTNELSEKTRDITRVLISLKEEIESINRYGQIIDTTSDKELKKKLTQNRDEKIEHACRALGWLRMNSDAWDENLQVHFFNKEELSELEDVENTESDLGIEKIKSKAQKRYDELSHKLSDYKNNVMDQMDEVPDIVSERYQDAKKKLSELESEMQEWSTATGENWKKIKKDVSGRIKNLRKDVKNLFEKK